MAFIISNTERTSNLVTETQYIQAKPTRWNVTQQYLLQ
jgi:hypothetical protein